MGDMCLSRNECEDYISGACSGVEPSIPGCFVDRAHAGECTSCGGSVFHREGSPGEFDHECKSHGGKRKGAGRKPGSKVDNVKLGISISKENAEWLKAMKKQGKSISRLIDMALTAWRDRER